MSATDYDFLETRTDIISGAYRLCRVVSPDDTPSANQLIIGANLLNTIVKGLQADGIFLWQLVTFTVTVGNAVTTYNLSTAATPTSPTIVSLHKAFRRDTPNTDVPIEIMSFGKYNSIPMKSDAGDPVVVSLNGQRPPTLYIWPTPASGITRTLFFVGVARLKDFDSANGSGDFPEAYQMSLRYFLANELGGEYGIPVTERQSFLLQGEYWMKKARQTNIEQNDYEFVRGAYPTK